LGRHDVTRNVKTILTVPLNIHSILAGKEPPVRLEVWGIVYVERDADPSYGIHGSMQDMDSAFLIGADVRDTARHPLNMFCYGAEQESELVRHIGAESHFEVMLMLQDWGFRVNKPHIRLCTGSSDVIQAVRLIEEQRESSSYELNGAMVQLNLMAHRSAIENDSDGKGVVEYVFKASENRV
jgi:NAD-dependent DNA ligase